MEQFLIRHVINRGVSEPRGRIPILVTARDGVEESGIAGRYAKVDGGDRTGRIGSGKGVKWIAILETGAVESALQAPVGPAPKSPYATCLRCNADVAVATKQIGR